jgi:hypothetical protein
MKKFYFLPALLLILMILTFLIPFSGCDDEDMPAGPMPSDPDTAPRATIDRFSDAAGTLFVRDGSNGLPGPGEPVDFDQVPFITQGFGPSGEVVQYYNFDVQPIVSAPIFALFREGESQPVGGQLNIIDVIPGDEGYNDFWHVHRVTVPSDYEANTISSVGELMRQDYDIERTNMIVNCPVVPEGSTADLRFGDMENSGLIRGWYRDQVVFYFSFEEEQLTVNLPADGHPEVPVSDILVSFNINPGESGGGPSSGFMTEGDTPQTHNVVQTIPGSSGYSPLWDVDVYDNADFNSVYNWTTALQANQLAEGVALVNCPVVSVEEGNLPMNPDEASKVGVDRFSSEAGTLFVRNGSNGLPEANEPVDFDQEPFITRGLGPAGQSIQYYNFDVQSLISAPIFVLFREGEDTPVDGQLNIIDVIPGESGYNDFWHVHRVTVPAWYQANTVTSLEELMAMDYTIERTPVIVNCPVVPEASTAQLRFGKDESNGLIRGWYRDQVVYYFSFEEKTLMVDPPEEGHPEVPLSDILVTFNINPGQDGGGPPSGFKTETDSDQTHNVVETLPTDENYSPFWDVNIYDNAGFDMVSDWESAMMAMILAESAAFVNCPVVIVE